MIRESLRRVVCAMGIGAFCVVLATDCSPSPGSQPQASDHESTSSAPAAESAARGLPGIEQSAKAPEKESDGVDLVAEHESLAMTLIQIGDAWEARDLERVMTFFSEDYSDLERTSKESLRATLEAIQTPGNMTLDTCRAQIRVSNDKATAYPVELRSGSIVWSTSEFVLNRQNGRWLIVSIKDDPKGIPKTETVEDVRSQVQTPEHQY